MEPREDGAEVVEYLDRDLSLQEATRRYDVSLQTLRNRLRCGQIPAYKTRGPWGREWRVSGRALEAAGLQRRLGQAGTDDDPRVAALEEELTRLRRIIVAERKRADLADQELGYAMLECGRLRSALAKASQPSKVRADGSRGTLVDTVGAIPAE